MLRGSSPDSCDYLIWPIRASFPDSSKSKEVSWPVEITLVEPSEFVEEDLPLPPSDSLVYPTGSFLEFTAGPMSRVDSFRAERNQDRGEWQTIDVPFFIAS